MKKSMLTAIATVIFTGIGIARINKRMKSIQKSDELKIRHTRN